MNLRSFLLTTSVALLFIVGPARPTVAQRPAPPITYTLDYYDADGYVVATNTSGLSVGISSSGAFVATPNGAKVLLSTMLSPSDQLVWRLHTATAVNENSQIAGRAEYYTGGMWVNVSYRYSPVSGSTPVIEPIFPTSGKTGIIVGGINDLGEVAGVTTGGTTADVIVFRGDVGNGLRSVVLTGLYQASSCLNNLGQITGMVTINGERRAFRYTPGSNLETFGSLATWKNQTFKSMGFGINDLGEWVGEANAVKTKSGEYYHATLWSGSRLIDLGVLPGDTSSRANSINFNGTVVGVSYGATGNKGFVHMGGYMYSVPEVMLTALPPGVSGFIPRHVNNAGDISGEVLFTGTTVRGGFVLVPAL